MNEDGNLLGLAGGFGVLLVQACAIIPGLLPCLLLALPLVLPLLALGVVAGVLVGIPVGIGRLIRGAMSHDEAGRHPELATVAR
jgi:hypothetical protein